MGNNFSGKVLLIIPLIMLSFISCATKKKCDQLFESYTKARENYDYSLALKKINKALICNPKNQNYEEEKINLYLYFKRYNEAIDFIDSIQPSSSSNLIKGVLMLKVKPDIGQKYLKEELENLIGTKSVNVDSDFNRDFNIIVLNNYLFGKDKTLKKIEVLLEKYKSDYHVKTLKYLKNQIELLDEKQLLFNVFNIEN